MFDVFGSLHGVEIATWLGLVPALPLFAFVISAYLMLAAEPATRADAKTKQRAVWRGGAVLTVATLVLVRWGHEGIQLGHVARFFRVGRTEASLDLVLDPLSIFVAGGIAVAACAMSFFPDDKQATTKSALSGPLLESGALIVALADNVPTALTGGVIASVAVIMMAERSVGSFAMDRISDAFLVVGCATLAWALGGGFAAGEFLSDMNPRLAVASGSHEEASAAAPHSLSMGEDDEDEERARPQGHKPIDLTGGGKGTLTIASLPGALVFLDDSRTPLVDPKAATEKAPARSPIVRITLPAGIHRVRVRAAESSDDTVLAHVLIATAADTRLLLLGPTTSLREAGDQVGMKWLSGEVSLGNEVRTHEAWPGVRLLTLACAALGLGVLLRLLGAGFAPRMGLPLAVSSFAFLGVLAQAGRVLSLEPQAAGVVAACSVVAALWFAALATRSEDVEGVLARAATAKGCLVLVGVLTGATAAAMIDLALSLVALALLHRVRLSLPKTAFAEAVVTPQSRSPWFYAWVAGGVALVASPALAIELASAYSFSTGIAGILLLGAAALTLALLAHGLARSSSLTLAQRGKKKAAAGGADPRPWVALGVVSFAVAAVVGSSSRLAGADVSLPIAILGLGIAIGGASVAHQRFNGIKSPEALATADGPLSAISNASRKVTGLGVRVAGFIDGLAPAEVPAGETVDSQRGPLSAGLAVLAVSVVLAVAAVWASR